MNLTECRFEDLSDLTYRIFTCDLGGNHHAKTMVLEFSGSYGVGSEGNGDADFMRVISLAALSIWHVDAVVFDLRQLDYKWGNSIWVVFGGGLEPSGVEDLPMALVVSDRCRAGFTSCAGVVPQIFDDLEAAVDFVRQPAIESLDRLFAKLDGDAS